MSDENGNEENFRNIVQEAINRMIGVDPSERVVSALYSVLVTEGRFLEARARSDAFGDLLLRRVEEFKREMNMMKERNRVLAAKIEEMEKEKEELNEKYTQMMMMAQNKEK